MVSLGRKYLFATAMCLVLCILTRCSSVLCVFMTWSMFMFVNIMSSLMNVMSPPRLFVCLVGLFHIGNWNS